MIVCKGFCDQRKCDRKKRSSNPFATSSFCKRCDWWCSKQINVKCPCCHGILRTRPRHSKQKRMWRERHV